MKRIVTLILLFMFPLVLQAKVEIRRQDRERARMLCSRMTLEEKCSFIAGCNEMFTYPVPRINLPSYHFSDGPQGVRSWLRHPVRSTYFPCGIAVAATWNRDLAESVGYGIGEEAKARGIAVMLCPGVNIYRSPLCGRNFEYMGEDPYLTGEMASRYIAGVQKNGVIATIKHFALNNSEYDRHNVSSNVDWRTMNEIYFPAFRKAIEEAGVGAVMTSYNPVNGVQAAENGQLIDCLRSWGHEGIVMSDWISTYSTLECVKSGLDLEMPSGHVMNWHNIKPLVDNGVVREEEIDAKVIHILQTFSAFGILDGKDAGFTPWDYRPDEVFAGEADGYDPETGAARALAAAIEAPVLLKNEGILPVAASKDNNIVILGPNADFNPWGGGSGRIIPREEYSCTLYGGLASLGEGYKVTLLEPGLDGSYDMDALREADIVIVAVGFNAETEREGHDRTYELPEGQDELIKTVTSCNGNVLVTVNAGGEIDMSRWKDDVRGIMMLWYPGQGTGRAFAKLFTGEVSPSGRLPFTFWGSWEKNPCFGSYHLTRPAEETAHDYIYEEYPFTEYREGVFVGYRGVEHFGTEPLYPFGYGLTYGRFKYSDASARRCGDGFEVSFKIENIGTHGASEVAQVYVEPPASEIMRPARELKGFGKTMLAPGESATMKIKIPRSAFACYSEADGGWTVKTGIYGIAIGPSSGNTALRLEVKIR